jgi:hypothetical protein
MGADDAFTRWIAESAPDVVLVANLLLWLSELEFDGPPSVVGFSADGFALAQGPGDLLIEFVVVPKPLSLGTDPPFASIEIRTIDADYGS